MAEESSGSGQGDAPKVVASAARLRGRGRGVAAAIVLGVLTPPLVAMLSGALIPLRGMGGGVVERDGDHMQLWMLQLNSLTGSRAIWFEKGRIYNKPGVGPAGGSSAAVANWSFATGTRSDGRFVKGTISFPVDERTRIDERPAKVWGVAVDRRGWPWAAMEARVAGTMDATSASPYVATIGVLLPTNMRVPGMGGGGQSFGGSDSLADVRVLPTRVLWAGWAADAVVMAAMWWVVLLVVGAAWSRVAARRRARLGCCRACGYDLAGLDGGVCPECGTARALPERAAGVPEKTTE